MINGRRKMELTPPHTNYDGALGPIRRPRHNGRRLLMGTDADHGDRVIASRSQYLRLLKERAKKQEDEAKGRW